MELQCNFFILISFRKGPNLTITTTTRGSMLNQEQQRGRNKSMNYGNVDRTSDLIEDGLITKRDETGRSGSYKPKPRVSNKHIKSKQSQPRKMLDKMLKRMNKNSTSNCKLNILNFFSKKNSQFQFKKFL